MRCFGKSFFRQLVQSGKGCPCIQNLVFPRKRQMQLQSVQADLTARNTHFGGRKRLFQLDVGHADHHRTIPPDNMLPDDLECFRSLPRADHRTHPRFADSALFCGNLCEGIPKNLGMVQPDRGNHTEQRMLNHVGGVKPSAQAGFQNNNAATLLGKPAKRKRGIQFKLGEFPRLFGKRLYPLDQSHQRILRDHLAIYLYPLPVFQHVRRNIHTGFITCCPQDACNHRNGRAFAVGARYVHTGKLLLWVAEQCEQSPHPFQTRLCAKASVGMDVGQSLLIIHNNPLCFGVLSAAFHFQQM